jgi:hypothetical protein
MNGIDWTNPVAQIAPHFTVRDALWLNTWGRLANASDGLTDAIKSNIIKTAAWLETVRGIVGKPLYVKSWFRPQKYNVAIGGARFSQHMQGNAVDWWTDRDGDGDKDGVDCDALKALLMPHLPALYLRMEDNGKGARWIHLDDRPVPRGGQRFFKP